MKWIEWVLHMHSELEACPLLSFSCSIQNVFVHAMCRAEFVGLY